MELELSDSDYDYRIETPKAWLTSKEEATRFKAGTFILTHRKLHRDPKPSRAKIIHSGGRPEGALQFTSPTVT